MSKTFSTIAVSGGFDPVHSGHIKMFKEAKKLGDQLLVFLNSDEFLIKKKGKCFMEYGERFAVLSSIRYVDMVLPVVDNDDTVRETLRLYKPEAFANGGDRVFTNVPETKVCRKLGIKMLWRVGGGKTQSSSQLLKRYGT